METKIVETMGSPKDLEVLYQENTDEFIKAFPAVIAKHPDSIVLQVWQERLNYQQTRERRASSKWSFGNILLIVLLVAVAGTILKLPGFFKNLDEVWFYTRNTAAIFIIPLIAYFLLRNRSPRFIVTTLLVAGLALLYLDLLPSRGDNSYQFSKMYGAFDDALANAELHIPLFLWLLLGVVFSGRDWKTTPGRMRFLQYNGELIIYSTILVIGGVLLTSITLVLFEFIENSYELTEWYTGNVLFYGIVAVPLVATFLLDRVIDKRLNIAPTIARIFTPLFLITTIAYLIIMAVYRKNPFGDREDLLVLNVLLIIVLGLLIFSISERDPKVPAALGDYLNIGLAFTITLLDLIALSAALFRLSNDTFGLTPNRVAVLGLNLLIFGHLAGILTHYIRFVWRNKPFENLENWIAGYLPLYAIWALLVSIMLPVLYWYK